MQIALIGLGKMGANMARRWARGGVNVVAFDRSAEARESVAETNITPVASLAETLAEAATPRLVWLMLPSGEITEGSIDALIPMMIKGDLLVDGGNANYKDSVRRAVKVNSAGIGYADVGVPDSC